MTSLFEARFQVFLIFLPATRFLIRPFPPAVLAARFFAAFNLTAIAIIYWKMESAVANFFFD